MERWLILAIGLLCLGSILFLGPTPVMATSYMLFDEWGGTYYDAEKSSNNSEDDLMCWAASAANILSWTGWGYPSDESFTSEDDIFSYFQDNWTDLGGSVYYGYDWWFDGENDSQRTDWEEAGWSQVDGSAESGGFWTDYELSDYFLYSSWDDYALTNIAYLIDNGYGTSISVTNDSGGHAITAWGYELDEYGNFIGVWVTDSDDDENKTNPEDTLVYYDVLYSNEAWFLQDFYSKDSWYITEVCGLAQAPTAIDATPEPGSLILFASGLLGLCYLYRRQPV